METIAAYDNAPEALLEAVEIGEKRCSGGDAASQSETGAEDREGLSPEALLQTIVGSIGDLDSPMSPDQKGFAALSR